MYYILKEWRIIKRFAVHRQENPGCGRFPAGKKDYKINRIT
jgi:hypothetical protein